MAKTKKISNQDLQKYYLFLIDFNLKTYSQLGVLTNLMFTNFKFSL
jgi:hypothetical protein